MRSQKGFTLIELLVVIGIIGILSAIVLVALRGARVAAQDAATKLALGQARTAAEVYYNTWNGYNTAMNTTGQDFSKAMTEAQAQSGNAPTVKIISSRYCVGITLRGGSTWCIDSELSAKAASCVSDASPICL